MLRLVASSRRGNCSLVSALDVGRRSVLSGWHRAQGKGISDPQSNPQKRWSYTTSVVLGVPHGFVSGKTSKRKIVTQRCHAEVAGSSPVVPAVDSKDLRIKGWSKVTTWRSILFCNLQAPLPHQLHGISRIDAFPRNCHTLPQLVRPHMDRRAVRRKTAKPWMIRIQTSTAQCAPRL
jgi:hypothetical protein